jgi:chaperonin GroEL
MLFQTQKPKSAGKVMIPPSQKLDETVLSTLEFIAEMVGATLGPNGRQVLVERAEMGLKPIMTKDGVTVVKNLGFKSAVRQLILEAARDAAIRTASEAGDGTTTATILSASIARQTAEVVRANPKLSPQKIVREMQSLVPIIEALVKRYAVDGNDEDVLRRVAKLSANGDAALADKIIESINLVGDEGNLTIVEHQGNSRYEVERIKGYALDSGYEEACRNFANGFINDKSGTLVCIDDPIFILFDGVVTDINQVVEFFTKAGDYLNRERQTGRGCVLLAHGYSESVVAEFHTNWNYPASAIKVFPLVTPKKGIMNWSSHVLRDLQAYTGAPVFNPLDKPLSDADMEQLAKGCRVKYFECGRFSTNIIANEDDSAIELRSAELKQQLKKAPSQYEENDIQVRIGKLTSGIARLKIYGPSTIETREKRDRAEDAWMAIRGAIKHGAVPGGGYVLVKIAAELMTLADKVEAASLTGKLALNILALALLRPVEVLYENYGFNEQEIEAHKILMLKNDGHTYDILEQRWVDKDDLLDSAPAVIEAIRNSISIASLFGTIGGVVAFERDDDTDKAEEDYVRRFTAATGERAYE